MTDSPTLMPEMPPESAMRQAIAGRAAHHRATRLNASAL